ncbi:hypothetical protein D8W71_19720 [Rhodococcus sp. P1Y]|nr:hypothetical protein D8W71_19720 [Rhodococcus sp. P1Y]
MKAGPGQQSRSGCRVTTVDISDCEHADCDQRQFMADLVLGCVGHGQKSSRGFGRTLILRPSTSSARSTWSATTPEQRVPAARRVRA